MSTRADKRLSVQDMEAMLAVTRKLAAPFDLMTMLTEVVDAAKQVLHAEWGSVWLYDPAEDELVLEIATGIAPVRVPASAGIVGACARARQLINVPDCYADDALQSRDGPLHRPAHALHAGPAADRPQGRAGRA